MEIKLLADFVSRFFNFFDEKFPVKNIHKLPQFYSELGLTNLLPFSRGNKVRVVEMEFRKLVLGGKWSRAKLDFLMRRLLHFSEIWLMGPLGFIFALVHLASEKGERGCLILELPSLRAQFDFFENPRMVQLTKRVLQFVEHFSKQINFFIPNTFFVLSKEKLSTILMDPGLVNFLRDQARLAGYKEDFLTEYFEGIQQRSRSRFRESSTDQATSFASRRGCAISPFSSPFWTWGRTSRSLKLISSPSWCWT